MFSHSSAQLTHLPDTGTKDHENYPHDFYLTALEPDLARTDRARRSRVTFDVTHVHYERGYPTSSIESTWFSLLPAHLRLQPTSHKREAERKRSTLLNRQSFSAKQSTNARCLCFSVRFARRNLMNLFLPVEKGNPRVVERNAKCLQHEQIANSRK
jgi:hypothetical protein